LLAKLGRGVCRNAIACFYKRINKSDMKIYHLRNGNYIVVVLFVAIGLFLLSKINNFLHLSSPFGEESVFGTLPFLFFLLSLPVLLAAGIRRANSTGTTILFLVSVALFVVLFMLDKSADSELNLWAYVSMSILCIVVVFCMTKNTPQSSKEKTETLPLLPEKNLTMAKEKSTPPPLVNTPTSLPFTSTFWATIGIFVSFFTGSVLFGMSVYFFNDPRLWAETFLAFLGGVACFVIPVAHLIRKK